MIQAIVTSGPTCEPLDRIRFLSNHSTGRTGTGLANHLTGLGIRVIHLGGTRSTWKGECRAGRIHPFTTTEDLRRRFDSLARERIHAVFHVAAVSDFRFGRIGAGTDPGRRTRGKLPSREGPLPAELVPTRKILPALRTLFPRAMIVGWKYEVEGNRKSAVEASRRQLQECRSDFSVINGPAYGKGSALVEPDREALHASGPEELYGHLSSRLLSRCRDESHHLTGADAE